MKKFLNNLFDWEFLPIIIIFIVGFIMGGTFSSFCSNVVWERAAVSRGYGEWKVNTNTVQVEFHWKENKP